MTPPAFNSNNVYGSAEIGGHATVQLGDRQVSNNFHITTAFITIQPKHDRLPRIERSGLKRPLIGNGHEPSDTYPTKRLKRRHSVDDADANLVTRQNHPLDPKVGVSYAPESAVLQRRCNQTEKEGEGHPVIRITANPDLDGNSDATTAVAARAMSSNRGRKMFQALLDCVCAGWLSSRVLGLDTANATFENVASDSVMSLAEKTVSFLDTASTRTGPIHDLSAIVLAIMSFVACDKILAKHVVFKREQDRGYHVLSLLFIYGIIRYFCLPQIARCISEFTGDCIIVEDACREPWRVPMSHCEHFRMLKAYLEFRHQGRPGETLVKAGQFNLMLGSRRGLAIRTSDWTKQGPIKPNSRVVMSVFITTDDARCTKCQKSLTISAMGEFHCTPCQTFYRDLDTLKYLPQVGGGATNRTLPQHTRCARLETSPENVNILEKETGQEEDDDDYDVDGVKYIDLRIIPRRKPCNTAKNLKLLERARLWKLRILSEAQDNGSNSPRPSTKAHHLASEHPGPSSPATSTMSYQKDLFYRNDSGPVKEKCFPCSRCPPGKKPFSTKNDEERHRKTFHGVFYKGERIFLCKIPGCSSFMKIWVRFDNLKQHVLRMHGYQWENGIHVMADHYDPDIHGSLETTNHTRRARSRAGGSRP